MNDEIIELLRDDEARLRAGALFGNPGDSLSLRIPGREELVLVTSQRSDPAAFPFDTTGLEAAELHATIYRRRKDAGGILVGQTPWSAALASVGAKIPALFDEQARHIGSASAPVPKGDQAGLLRALGGGANIAIYGDCRVCIGTTPNRVVFNAELFEKCAKAFVIACAGGGRIRELPRWVRRVAGARLRRDQSRAASSYAAGRIPEGMDGYG